MIRAPDIPEADEEAAIARGASPAAGMTGLSGLSRFMPDETCLLAPHRSALRLPVTGIMEKSALSGFHRSPGNVDGYRVLFAMVRSCLYCRAGRGAAHEPDDPAETVFPIGTLASATERSLRRQAGLGTIMRILGNAGDRRDAVLH